MVASESGLLAQVRAQQEGDGRIWLRRLLGRVGDERRHVGTFDRRADQRRLARACLASDEDQAAPPVARQLEAAAKLGEQRVAFDELGGPHCLRV